MMVCTCKLLQLYFQLPVPLVLTAVPMEIVHVMLAMPEEIVVNVQLDTLETKKCAEVCLILVHLKWTPCPLLDVFKSYLSFSIGSCDRGVFACVDGECTCNSGYTGPDCCDCADNFYRDPNDGECKSKTSSCIIIFVLALLF